MIDYPPASFELEEFELEGEPRDDAAIAALHASVAYLGPQAASSDAVLTVAGKFHDWIVARREA